MEEFSEFDKITNCTISNIFKTRCSNSNPFQNRKELIEAWIFLMRAIITNDKQIITSEGIETEKLSNLITTFQKELDILEVESIGIHFIDDVVGRISQLELTANSDRRKFFFKRFPKNNIKAKNAIDLFSKLWMLSYKEIVKTNTSLVNSYYENKLKWNTSTKPIRLNWISPEEEKISSFDEYINLNFDTEFIKLNSDIAEEVEKIIFNVLMDNKDLLSKTVNTSTIDFLFSLVSIELKESSIFERLEEIVILTRLKILNYKKVRESFFSTLMALSFDSDEVSMDKSISEIKEIYNSGPVNARKDLSWFLLKELLESIQSAILSEYSFCSKKGFQILKLDPLHTPFEGDNNKAINLFLIIVSKKSLQNTDKLKSLFDILFKSIERVSKTPHYKQISSNSFKNANSLLDHSDEKLKIIIDKTTAELKKTESGVFNALERWLSIVYLLSSESIHESREIEFLFGFGASFRTDIYFKKFVPSPDYLSNTNSDCYQIIHFIKSYYSLFEFVNNKIVWFDSFGRFIGVYSYDDKYETLLELTKSEDIWYAKINGKDKFDLIFKSHTPFMRVDKFNILTSFVDEELLTIIKKASGYIFPSNPNPNKEIEAISQLVYKIAIMAKTLKIGTSLIIINKDNKFKKEFSKCHWNSPISDQSKRLTIEMERYKKPFLSRNNLLKIDEKGNGFSKDIINELILLARLDGSIILSIDKEGLFVDPSNFAVPLIKEKKKTKHLDYFSLKKSNAEHSDNLSDIKEQLETGARIDLSQIRYFFKEIENLPSNGKLSGIQNSLAFLNSAGTRHHSLWGISLTTNDPLFVVTISEAGNIRVFWNGLNLTKN